MTERVSSYVRRRLAQALASDDAEWATWEELVVR